MTQFDTIFLGHRPYGRAKTNHATVDVAEDEAGEPLEPGPAALDAGRDGDSSSATLCCHGEGIVREGGPANPVAARPSPWFCSGTRWWRGDAPISVAGATPAAIEGRREDRRRGDWPERCRRR